MTNENGGRGPKKEVSLRDRLLAEQQAIKMREEEISKELGELKKNEEVTWVNARVREDRHNAESADPSRMISDTHQKQLADIWGKVYRHDLSPEMMEEAAEKARYKRANEPLAKMGLINEEGEIIDGDGTEGEDNPEGDNEGEELTDGIDASKLPGEKLSGIQ